MNDLSKKCAGSAKNQQNDQKNTAENRLHASEHDCLVKPVGISGEKVIPVMDHPLGRAWSQPKRQDIIINATQAFISARSFNCLHNYSHSLPSGVYSGKMWKQLTRDKSQVEHWWLCWFVDSTVYPNSCTTNRRKIVIL